MNDTEFCQEHCELVIRLHEWRAQTEERFMRLETQIKDLVEGTKRLKTAAWIVLTIVITQDQGKQLVSALLGLVK